MESEIIIGEADCLRLILERHPGFQPMYDEHMEWWSPDAPAIGDDLTKVSEYALDLIDRNNQSELKKLLELIDELIVRGAPSVSNAAKTGFLEAMLHAESHGAVEAGDFVPLLGPESRTFCRSYNVFRGVEVPGL